MEIRFSKYHALENDFLIIQHPWARIIKSRMGRLARSVCRRRSGIGADGVLCLSRGRQVDHRLDVFNADGSWAEKSGNGLRIAGGHHYRQDRRKKRFRFETAGGVDQVTVRSSAGNSCQVYTELGRPEFRTERIPVKTRFRHMLNSPLTLGGTKFPVTCVAVGNPHTVLFVNDFDFDWHTLGAEIERHRLFPHRTNVEFVRVVNRRLLRVADWERGAGATGSSGTGAAAAVCAAVMLGYAERNCRVQFATGDLQVNWDPASDIIGLSGPVEFVCEGTFDWK